MREAESQRHLRKSAVLGSEFLLQRAHPFHHLLLAIAAKIEVSEIVRLELGVLRDLAREASLIERHPGDDAYVLLLGQWKQMALRALIEDVVDHLHSVDQARFDNLQRGVGLMIVN